MNIEALTSAVKSIGATNDGGPDLFSVISKLAAACSLASTEHEIQSARELLIRLLEKEEQVAELNPYSEIIDSLVRQLGLFPYLRFDGLPTHDAIAAEAHRALQMPNGVIFTSKQGEVYRELLNGNSVVLSAPTSFGKSLIIDALVAARKYNNIVIVVPTLALVDETRRRLMQFSPEYKVITHPSQLPGKKNLFVHTQERVLENKHITKVDFFVIDEFYKLAMDNEGSDERRILLNQAFYKLSKLAKQFYMLGPNIDHIPDQFERTYRCKFISTRFTTVAADIHMVPEGNSDNERLAKLVPTLLGRTLYFAASPNKAREYSDEIVEVTKSTQESARLSDVVTWLSQHFTASWGVVRRLKAGVGIHHAKLPRSVAQMMVGLFNNDDIKHLVCTSTLIEGVNTAARNVVIMSNKISNKKYGYFTFNNIKGRSGRMREHFVGQVYLFNKPPKPDTEFVDVPVFTQNEDAPEALLIQLDPADLRPPAAERLEPIWQQQILHPEVIKANAALDPTAQINLAREIETNLNGWNELLAWSGPPTYDELEASLKLACHHFGFRGTEDVKRVGNLIYKIHQYRLNPDYQWQIQNAVAGKSGAEADEALEWFLEFTRQWVCFKAPRWLSALNRIQEYIFKKNGFRPGSYGFFCGQLESLFMPTPIVALEEYGVPIQLTQKIHKTLGSPQNLDEALEALGKVNPAQIAGLSDFERGLLAPLCRRDGALRG